MKVDSLSTILQIILLKYINTYNVISLSPDIESYKNWMQTILLFQTNPAIETDLIIYSINKINIQTKTKFISKGVALMEYQERIHKNILTKQGFTNSTTLQLFTNLGSNPLSIKKIQHITSYIIHEGIRLITFL